ncbi:MAG TPA: hypothetical protein DER01_00670, partial [Phycisphaerales bacterium]|nr:hypothetical protein [Phycisphaerales bacterium]
SLGVDSIVGTISNQTSEAVSSITKIAESATGTTSETGSTINKLALPAMILAGLFLILKSGVFK